MFTVAIYVWNFGILGMFCIHWKGPLFLQQVFNIFSCTQMALLFIKYLPDWTTWVLLAFISIWGLYIVLFYFIIRNYEISSIVLFNYLRFNCCLVPIRSFKNFSGNGTFKKRYSFSWHGLFFNNYVHYF